MKTKYNVISSLILASLFFSCDNNFDPKGELKENYSLYFVINADTAFQVATIKKSYDVDGFDPYTNLVDPSVLGARIELLQDNQVFTFRDSTIAPNEKWRYDTPIPFYYLNNFQPESRKEITINATLPDGTVLSSQISTPGRFRLFPTLSSRFIDLERRFIDITWDNFGEDVFFDLKLILDYYKMEQDTLTPYTVEVPINFVNDSNGNLSPVYPIITGSPFIRYRTDSFSTLLSEISKGDTAKSNYFIDRQVRLEVISMSSGLATYISSISTFEDGYSVRTQAPQYTNVEGGTGVVGMYFANEISLILSIELIAEFRYKIYQGN